MERYKPTVTIALLTLLLAYPWLWNAEISNADNETESKPNALVLFENTVVQFPEALTALIEVTQAPVSPERQEKEIHLAQIEATFEMWQGYVENYEIGTNAFSIEYRINNQVDWQLAMVDGDATITLISPDGEESLQVQLDAEGESAELNLAKQQIPDNAKIRITSESGAVIASTAFTGDAEIPGQLVLKHPEDEDGEQDNTKYVYALNVPGVGEIKVAAANQEATLEVSQAHMVDGNLIVDPDGWHELSSEAFSLSLTALEVASSNSQGLTDGFLVFQAEDLSTVD